MGCTKTADTGVTQELLSLVTGMAQNLKSLIRIGLAQALRLVREKRVITGTTDQHAHHLYTHTPTNRPFFYARHPLSSFF